MTFFKLYQVFRFKFRTSSHRDPYQHPQVREIDLVYNFVDDSIFNFKPDLAKAHEDIGESYGETGNINLAEKPLDVLRNLGSDEADGLKTLIKKQELES